MERGAWAGRRWEELAAARPPAAPALPAVPPPGRCRWKYERYGAALGTWPHVSDTMILETFKGC